MIATQQEPIPARSIYNGALAGVVAAAVGAAAWGVIVWLTNYEIGIAAIGIGLLVGWAVLMASGRRKGLPLQLVAVLASVAGILAGKYVTVYLEVREVVGDELAFTDPFVFQLLTTNLDAFFSLFDLLWIGLAVFTAWRFLAPDPPAEPVAAPASGYGDPAGHPDDPPRQG